MMYSASKGKSEYVQDQARTYPAKEFLNRQSHTARTIVVAVFSRSSKNSLVRKRRTFLNTSNVIYRYLHI